MRGGSPSNLAASSGPLTSTPRDGPEPANSQKWYETIVRDPLAVATALGLTPEAVQQRLEAMELDASARARLAAHVEGANRAVGPFLDRLYRHFFEFPDTQALIASDAQVARLKEHQRRYFGELFGAPTDFEYVLRRLWIGVVHHRVRLSPRWYLATYAHFVCEHIDWLLEAAASPEAGSDAVVTLLRSVFFDASLALDAYGRSEEAALWSELREASATRVSSSPAARSTGVTATPPAAVGFSYSRIRLTGESTAERRRFIGLSQEDIRTLRGLEELIAREVPGILDDFYEFLSKVPEMAALVPPSVVERLKAQVRSYWVELARSSFERPHAASRMRIGVVHEKIGVTSSMYLTGLARQVARLVQALLAERPGDAAAVRALVRAVFFDLSFAIDAYLEARADTLLRTEGYASQLVAGLASAVAVVDRQDRLLSANRTLLSLTGGDPAVLYMMPIERIVPVPEVPALVRSIREQRSSQVVGMGRLGSRSLKLTAMPLAGEPGLEGSVAILMEDVTDILRIGAEFQEEADQFRRLADAVGSVIWEMDLDTEIITAINAAAVDVTGHRDVHFLGRPLAWRESVAEPDRERFLRVARAVRPGSQAELDYRMLRADGREIWVRSRLGSVPRGDSTHLVASTIDITQSRRTEALRREALGKTAGGVAHVVNNSLTGVIGFIELFAEENGGLESAPLLREALDATRKASSMATRLLAFAGRQVLRPTPVSLSDVVSVALGRIGALLGPSVRIETDLPEVWECRVDREMLITCLESLADNSREAMAGMGRVRIETRNRPRGSFPPADEHGSDEWVELVFSDSGSGMTEHVKSHAFEPFFSTRSLAEGTGLGLSMVYGFVAQSGGHLHIDSTPGAGTAIALRFPRVEPGSLRGRGPNPVVLLVEDEDNIRHMTATMLRRIDCRVYDTGSVDEALRLASEVQPDVLLTDIVLGQGTDGVALAVELRSERPDLRVVLTSAYAAGQFDTSALTDGFQFLAKPFSLAQVRHCVDIATRGALAQPPFVH